MSDEDPVEERYGAGWISPVFFWACDDCLHEVLGREADEAVADVDAVSGVCDTVHEARAALIAHNAGWHGGRAFA